VRHARDDADRQPAEHEEDRVRHVQHPREGDQRGDREQQPSEDQLGAGRAQGPMQ
jgi:hypothetical protein